MILYATAHPHQPVSTPNEWWISGVIFGAFGDHRVFFGTPGDIFLGGVLGVIFRLWAVILGIILGASGGHFEGLGRSLGAFLDVFSRVGKKRGFTQLALCTFRAQSGPKGAKMGPKMEPKSSKHRSKNQSTFRWLFLSPFFVDVGPLLMPKWSQSGTKVDAKTDMNAKRPQSLKCNKTQ